jgi:hypothetical protein
MSPMLGGCTGRASGGTMGEAIDNSAFSANRMELVIDCVRVCEL